MIIFTWTATCCSSDKHETPQDLWKWNGWRAVGSLRKHEATQTTSATNDPFHILVASAWQILFKNKKKSLHRARSATRFKFFCSTEGMPGRNSLQSGISAIRGDMELICLIKCLTELAFGVQREFKQKGRDEIRSVEGEGGWHIVAVEENKETKTRRGGGEKVEPGWFEASHLAQNRHFAAGFSQTSPFD